MASKKVPSKMTAKALASKPAAKKTQVQKSDKKTATVKAAVHDTSVSVIEVPQQYNVYSGASVGLSFSIAPPDVVREARERPVSPGSFLSNPYSDPPVILDSDLSDLSDPKIKKAKDAPTFTRLAKREIAGPPANAVNFRVVLDGKYVEDFVPSDHKSAKSYIALVAKKPINPMIVWDMPTESNSQPVD